MTSEFSPLRMQMGGMNIYEHRGDSGTHYLDNALVSTGELMVGGGVVPQNDKFAAVHKDGSLTEYTKDGVPVELIDKEAYLKQFSTEK